MWSGWQVRYDKRYRFTNPNYQPNKITKTLGVIQPSLPTNWYILLLSPAVYLSKVFTVLLLSLPYCQPPRTRAGKPIRNSRPPVVVCQMPASDIVHHRARVSEANCHLFFPPLFVTRNRKKKSSETGEGEIWLKLSARARYH